MFSMLCSSLTDLTPISRSWRFFDGAPYGEIVALVREPLNTLYSPVSPSTV